MKSFIPHFLLISTLFACITGTAQSTNKITIFNSAIDNQGYWKAAAEAGFTVPNPMRSAQPATFTGSEIRALSVTTEDSPDVVIVTGSTSQSENSVFINPNDPDNPLNSNNSTGQPSGNITFYGANYLYSYDAGENWDGSLFGAGGGNSGDPTTAIGLNGRWYVGSISNSYGMNVAYSDNEGASWSNVLCAPSPGGSGLDKNHLWIDNVPGSPHEGNLYNSWTAFGGNNNNEIEITRSINDGVAWSSPQNISGPCNAGNHCQGVNIQTGPNGEVFVAFCIYDSWPADEDAIGFARSFDGGQTWESFRIIDNIRGIRTTGTGKNMRVNSFPVMACDISNGPNRGNIYVTWANVGIPGSNSGSDVDVYMIRSEDDGETWSEPIRVNQDPSGMGKKHYLGWITCDPASGTLSMVFYDDRNVSGSQVEVFCANSTDAGNTWEDFKVSDVAFSPSPIPGLASQYFGDYLGISARNGKVYPVWTDNRTGTALAYTSPYQTSTMVAPINLIGQVNQGTGQVNLTWTHQGGPTFENYNIYRNFVLIGTSTLPFYMDMLPEYGVYRYQVTAVYTIEGESTPAIADVQWGFAQAETNPDSVEVFVLPDETASTIMGLSNTGELELEYTSGFSLPEGDRETAAFCTGLGGCGGEGVAGVLFGDIANFSGCSGYEDYSALSYQAEIGESFAITINNITNIHSDDICGIWVDWNQNESFTDDGTITVTGSPGPGPYTATITVPDNAKNGDARLRIRIRRGGTLSPCGSASTGEVEDYSVNVLAWVTASPKEGTVEPGSGQDITFSFDALGLDIGDYQANFTIYSNDPDNGELVVPVTMHVQNASVNITTYKDSLCLGGSTILNTVVIGGSGNYTYSWTSNPTGFISDEANPLVAPTVTTTYYVEVSDGSIMLEDQITITVLPLPQIDLGEDLSVCTGETAILDAGAGFTHYLWSTGGTTQTIEISEAGSYWVEVTNEFDCTKRDTLNLAINPLPEISLGPDGIICAGSTIVLAAGSDFVVYLWSTGETTTSIYVTEPGEYWVAVTDGNGCTNSDTIALTSVPGPEISLGNDQEFCEGTTVTLDAGSGFASYLWSTGATSQTISAGQPGEYWVEVSDASTCSNRDTVMLTMDPLPVAPETISGPASVDNFLNPSSSYTCSESLYATSYDWQLEPTSAGTISQYPEAPEISIEWAAGFTGIANLSARGFNDCGTGNYSQNFAVSVYSSQGIGEQNMIAGIKLFPNPNNGTFVLQLTSAKDQELRFKITASGGNQVIDRKEYVKAGPYQKDFNLGHLPGGTYYLLISDADGKMLSRQQIVVQ